MSTEPTTPTSTVEQLSPVLVELSVHVPWERVRTELEKGYAKLARSASIRGFRKGKVPRNVIKQLFGPQVESDVASAVIQEGLVLAVRTHGLTPVAAPSVEPERIKEGQPLGFKAKLEVRPKVDELAVDGLEVTAPSFAVKDEDVHAELERLRQEHAELIEPDPMRPAKAGDQLVVDYHVHVDGEERPEMGAHDRTVELGADRLLDELEKALTGALPGEDHEAVVEFPADHASESLRGKKALFHVHVKDLREKRLPDLDDELAKDVGDHQTLEALRADVRGRLEEAAKRREKGALQEAIVDALCSRNPLPLPPSLVAEQEQVLRNGLRQTFGDRIPFDQNMLDSMHATAERQVRAALLLGEVAARHSLRVETADVDRRLEELAAAKGKNVAKLRAEYGDPRKREQLETDILHGKILEFLESRANIAVAPLTPGAAEPQDGENG